MNDNELKLQREIRELKAEVKRLRRLIEGAVAVIGLGVVIVFPQVAVFALGLVVASFLAFLVSPVRRLIFSYIFRKARWARI
jgi:hypothetical protein